MYNPNTYMEAVVLQEDFFKGLNIVSRFVASRPQLPVLSNILISAEKGKIKIAATNLEMGISLQIGAKVEKEGAITVPAKIIVELISNLPPGQLKIKEKEGQLFLEAKGFRGSLSGIMASEFPSVPDKIEGEYFVLKRDVLQFLTKQVCFAAAIDEGRPILTGILLNFSKNALKAVSTDGFRLSSKEISLDKFNKESKLLVPVRAIEEIFKSVISDEIKIAVLEEEKQILFAAESIVLTSRLLEGEFPDYQRIIPKGEKTKVTLEKEELFKAVKAVSVFARESSGIMKLKINKNGIILTAESQQYGRQEVLVDAKVEGEEIEIAFNYRYLLDFLGSVTGGQISLHTEGPTNPAVFRDTKDESYFHLIMPVRLQV